MAVSLETSMSSMLMLLVSARLVMLGISFLKSSSNKGRASSEDARVVLVETMSSLFPSTTDEDEEKEAREVRRVREMRTGDVGRAAMGGESLC